jgi:hypothetical protein
MKVWLSRTALNVARIEVIRKKLMTAGVPKPDTVVAAGIFDGMNA